MIVLERNGRNSGLGLGFDSGVDACLALGLDLVMLPPLVIPLPDSVCSRYVITTLTGGGPLVRG